MALCAVAAAGYAAAQSAPLTCPADASCAWSRVIETDAPDLATLVARMTAGGWEAVGPVAEGAATLRLTVTPGELVDAGAAEGVLALPRPARYDPAVVTVAVALRPGRYRVALAGASVHAEALAQRLGSPVAHAIALERLADGRGRPRKSREARAAYVAALGRVLGEASRAGAAPVDDDAGDW